ADTRHGRHPGGALAGLLGPDALADLLAGEPDLLAPVRSEAELHFQVLSHVGVPGLVVGAQSAPLPGIGHETIQRAAVQQTPAEPIRHQARDRAFARAARPVDGDDWLRHYRVTTLKPAARATPGKSGNEVATLATSRIRIGARERALAIANDIAIR